MTTNFPPSANDEMMANMTGMFRSLTSVEQDAWLQANGLTRVAAAPATTNTLSISPMKGALLKGAAGHSSNGVSPASGVSPSPSSVNAGALVPAPTSALGLALPVPSNGAVSPSRENFDQQRSARRSEMALRLAREKNETIDPLPMINVAQAKFTDADLRSWFDSLDTNKNGWLSYDEFRRFYGQLETFGAPVRQKDVEEQLKKLKAFDDDRMSYEEFALLVLHVAKR
jgi:hypothetical protein